jgi:FkbM family methyltransferase
MTLRDCVHAAGRLLTRGLLHPRWRGGWPGWVYLRLYLLGKRLTEKHELALLRRLVRPGMVVADIGANVGFYALEIAAAVGPSGRVLAFEPDPFNFHWLRSRCLGVGNVRSFPLALGDRAEDATLYISAYNRADNRVGQHQGEDHVEAHTVAVQTLDDVAADNQLPAIDALKIDVQGFEQRVLRGARATLARVSWIWIEFSPDHLRGAGADPEEFLRELGALPMAMYEVTDHGTLEPLADYAGHTAKIGAGYGDLLLVARGFAADPPLPVGGPGGPPVGGRG